MQSKARLKDKIDVTVSGHDLDESKGIGILSSLEFVSENDTTTQQIISSKRAKTKGASNHYSQMNSENPIKRRIKGKKGRRALRNKKKVTSKFNKTEDIAADPDEPQNMMSLFGEELHNMDSTNRDLNSTNRHSKDIP